MGGVLTPGDLRAAILGVKSVAEFRKLGDKILSPSPESTKDDVPIGNTPNGDIKEKSPSDTKHELDIDEHNVEYSVEEAAKIEKIRARRNELLRRKDMLAARTKFVTLLRQRAKGLVERLRQQEPKGGWKDICGFDMRLAWSDEEFDDWRLSEAGKLALVEGTVEALASSYPADDDTPMGGTSEEEINFLTRGVCIKKRCERHKQWTKVQQQDIVFEEDTADQDLAQCAIDERSVAERAVLRRWAEKENMPTNAK
jgi:COMPASS component SPP1